MRRAEKGDTTRLGRLLAPMGVRYVVIPGQLAPAPYDRGRRPAPPRLLDTLGQQLDLQEVALNSGITVYRNTAWAPSRALLPRSGSDRSDLLDAVGEDLSGSRPALTHEHGPTNAGGYLGRTGDLLVASAADPGWKLTIDGVPMSRTTAYGYANSFTVTRAGQGHLSYHTTPMRWLELAGQVLVWLLVVWAWRRYRRVDRSAASAARRGEG